MERNKQFKNSCKQFRSLVIQVIGIDHCCAVYTGLFSFIGFNLEQ